MGRDRAALAAAAAAAQKMKKQSKAEKVSTSASSSAGKLCTPSSPQSIASTAASTPTLGVRPPELGRAGQPLPEPGLLSLPEGALEASDALKQASSANCAVCGEQVQQAAAGHVQFYSCENPHHSHSFLSCSDRCAKKFAKECSKPSEARRKLPLAKRQTGQLSCPRCHFLIVAGQVSQSSLAADGGAGVKPCVETQEPPPKASPPPARDAFVPAELLPSGGEHRASREPRSRAAPQEAGLADAEEPRQPRGGRRPAELLFIFPGETETSDPNQEPPRDPAVAVQQQQELEEARRTVAEVDGQLSELEERLAQLPGQKNRKERNELNQRIVALKNQPEVLAAQRLVRDPAAEWKRRAREAKARGAEEERNEKVRDVVRWRLLEAIERSGDQCERAGEEHWAQLLREGRSSGLSEGEEAMKAVQAVLDAMHEKQRLQEERQKSEEAAKAYVQRLVCREVERAAETESRQQRPWRAAARTSTEGRWQGGSRVGGRTAGAAWAYKTQLCYRFELDSCPYGAKCTYAHGVEELRTRSWSGWQQERQRQYQRPRQQWPKARAPRERAAEPREAEGRGPEWRGPPPWRKEREEAPAASGPSRFRGDWTNDSLRGLRLPPPPLDAPPLEEEVQEEWEWEPRRGRQ